MFLHTYFIDSHHPAVFSPVRLFERPLVAETKVVNTRGYLIRKTCIRLYKRRIVALCIVFRQGLYVGVGVAWVMYCFVPGPSCYKETFLTWGG